MDTLSHAIKQVRFHVVHIFFKTGLYCIVYNGTFYKIPSSKLAKVDEYFQLETLRKINIVHFLIYESIIQYSNFQSDLLECTTYVNLNSWLRNISEHKIWEINVLFRREFTTTKLIPHHREQRKILLHWQGKKYYMMWSRGISRKLDMWHFQFSIWLKCSLGEVHFAENPTWIGPVVPRLWATEGFSEQ